MQEEQTYGDTKLIGNCNCGSVSFEIKGDLPGLYHCYCTLCQKQGGAASNAATIVYLEKFRWLAGENKIKKWQKETGFSSHFCSDCGSPVPNVFKDAYVWIPFGLMERLSPVVKANLWLGSKPDWATPSELEKNYESAPEDIEKFVQYLNSGEGA